jgi:hypothetical protein
MNSDANDTTGPSHERADRTDRSTERTDHSTERTGRSPQPLDEAQLGSLVRDVASDWELPPVRLDQPGWRDRVRSPRSRRTDTLSGWLGRVGRAATAAIALTVVAALVAVYLTRPPQSTGKAPVSSGPTPSGSTPRPTGTPTPTALPKLFVAGAAPSPSRVVVQTQSATFEVVDLSTGTSGKLFADSAFGSQVRTLANGDTVCVCIRTDTPGAGGEDTHVTVSLLRSDSSREAGIFTTTPVLEVRGLPDPREGGAAANAGNVSAFVTFNPEGSLAYVGWSARTHPSWTSGIVIVGLETGEVIQRLELPSTSDGTGTTRTYVDAPHVVGRAGTRALIDRNQYDYSPTGVPDPVFSESSNLFTAETMSSGSLKAPAMLPKQPCAFVDLSGGLPDNGIWTACTTQYGEATAIHRLASDGALLGSTSVDTIAIDGTTSVVSPDGSAIYVWNPITLLLTKVDLATGAKTTAQATAATSSAPAGGPLVAFGHWLAPTAAAKMFINPGIAMSPDGTRVYAIGAAGPSPNGGDLTGSSGVVVIDAAAMRVIATWPATADYSSIAINAGGSSLFLTGLPDVRADGTQSRSQPASLTVVDTSNGSVQAIAGDLGSAVLTFVEPVLEAR